MDVTLYKAYLKAKEDGLKKLASEHIRKFIDSFANKSEMLLWSRSFLEQAEYGYKIRHELYREVIFPVLFDGFKVGDAWSLFYLGKTAQNLYSDKSLHSQVEQLSDFEFFKRCYDISPELFDVRVSLADTVWRGVSFGVHEWPSGLCYEASEIAEDVKYLKALDDEGRYRLGIEEVEQILQEYYQTNKRQKSNL